MGKRLHSSCFRNGRAFVEYVIFFASRENVRDLIRRKEPTEHHDGKVARTETSLPYLNEVPDHHSAKCEMGYGGSAFGCAFASGSDRI